MVKCTCGNKVILIPIDLRILIRSDSKETVASTCSVADMTCTKCKAVLPPGEAGDKALNTLVQDALQLWVKKHNDLKEGQHE